MSEEMVIDQFPHLKHRADYSVHVNSTISTSDNQDHSHHGIMFDVEVKKDIPIENLTIYSVWIRGDLGKINIYCATKPHEAIYSEEEEWQRIYSKKHHSSFVEFVELKLDKPIVLSPGERKGIYLHSKCSQEAIIYDDERNEVTFENCFIKLHSGLANTTPTPFGPSLTELDWYWPWRPNREFVGKLSFGVRYILWRPISVVNTQFNPRFKAGVLETVKCFRSGKMGFKLYNDILFLILNMVRFDWFEPCESETKLVLEDRRREDGERIGWGMNDWTLYRRRILLHKETFMKRKGILTEFLDNRETNEYFSDETDSEESDSDISMG